MIGFINKLKIFEEEISLTWNTKTDLKFVQSGVCVCVCVCAARAGGGGGLLINLKGSLTNRKLYSNRRSNVAVHVTCIFTKNITKHKEQHGTSTFST